MSVKNKAGRLLILWQKLPLQPSGVCCKPRPMMWLLFTLHPGRGRGLIRPIESAGPKPTPHPRVFQHLSRLTAAVSREQLREGSALSNRYFDSTTAGVRVTLKQGLRKAVSGGEARSPRHTGPRSLVTASAEPIAAPDV